VISLRVRRVCDVMLSIVEHVTALHTFVLFGVVHACGSCVRTQQKFTKPRHARCVCVWMCADILRELLARAERGELTSKITKLFPLNKIREAYRTLLRNTTGRVVVQP
jgi:NADPH:quinone reductase-like Zn-dependent oxidoreductase